MVIFKKRTSGCHLLFMRLGLAEVQPLSMQDIEKKSDRNIDNDGEWRRGTAEKPEPSKTVRSAPYGSFLSQLPTSDENLVEDKVVRLKKTKNFHFMRFSI